MNHRLLFTFRNVPCTVFPDSGSQEINAYPHRNKRPDTYSTLLTDSVLKRRINHQHIHRRLDDTGIYVSRFFLRTGRSYGTVPAMNESTFLVPLSGTETTYAVYLSAAAPALDVIPLRVSDGMKSTGPLLRKTCTNEAGFR